MSSPGKRIERASDGTPLRYVVGGGRDRDGKLRARHVDPSIVGDAYARIPGAKTRTYLGPVFSGVSRDGGLALKFRVGRLPPGWESYVGGLELELELEPADRLDDQGA